MLGTILLNSRAGVRRLGAQFFSRFFSTVFTPGLGAFLFFPPGIGLWVGRRAGETAAAPYRSLAKRPDGTPLRSPPLVRKRILGL